MADTYGLDQEGRLPYSLLYERLKAEAESGKDDSYVTTVSLGSVRLLVKAMETFAVLQASVEEVVVSMPDGGFRDGVKLIVQDCEHCNRICLRQRDGS